MQYLPLVADLVLFCFACSSISVAESEKFVKSILCVCVCVCVRARARRCNPCICGSAWV